MSETNESQSRAPLLTRSCKYKDALGVPGQGFHSVRVLNVALLAVVGTFALALMFSQLTGASYLWSLLLMFGFGVGLHWLFCVETSLNKFLGL